MAYFIIQRATRSPAYYVGHTPRWWRRRHLRALWTERRTDPEVLQFTRREDAEAAIGAYRDMEDIADQLRVVQQGRA